MGQLDDSNLINYNPIPFSEDNNITATTQRGYRGAEWFTTDQTTCMNSSGTFISVDQCTLYTKENVCVVIAMSVIKRTLRQT